MKLMVLFDSEENQIIIKKFNSYPLTRITNPSNGLKNIRVIKCSIF